MIHFDDELHIGSDWARNYVIPAEDGQCCNEGPSDERGSNYARRLPNEREHGRGSDPVIGKPSSESESHAR